MSRDLQYLRDQFQVAAFRAHYKIARRAGDGAIEAFGKAIAQTSDDVTDKILEADPDALERWAKTQKRFKKYFE